MLDLIKHAQQDLYIRIYGTQVLDFPKADNKALLELGHAEELPVLISVHAIGYGNNDSCLPTKHFYLLVSGLGKPATCNGGNLPADSKVWVVKKSAISTRLDPISGTIEELLVEDSIEGENFGPVDLKVKPSLSVKIREKGPGNICIDYSAAVKAEYRLFGGSWKKLASASVGGSECIADNACIKVIDTEFISASICYRPNDNRICLEGKVGYKGVSVKIKQCFQL